MEFQELITALAEKTSYTRREIRHILRLLAEVIVENIETGRDVQIWGLGRFQNQGIKPRVGRNYLTGERVEIPASRRIKFEPIPIVKKRIKASLALYKKDSLEKKYGLPKKKEKHRGKVRGGHRP